MKRPVESPGWTLRGRYAATGVAKADCGSTRGTLTPRPWPLQLAEGLVLRSYHGMDTG